MEVAAARPEEAVPAAVGKPEKRKHLGQPRQALEGLTVKSSFDFIGRTEASRGARCWSWTKKSESTLVSPDKRWSCTFLKVKYVLPPPKQKHQQQFALVFLFYIT